MIRLGPHRAGLFALGFVVLAGLATGERAAFAQCPAPVAIMPDKQGGVAYPDEYLSFTVGAPYWVVVGVTGYDPNDDYDIHVYNTSSGGSPPECFSGVLAGSAYVGGYTDFVVGDFNHNPFSTYYYWLHCFSGHCDYVLRGVHEWRSGGFVAVDGGPLAVSITPGIYDPNEVVSSYDVYLNSGTTYYFQFAQTGDTQAKLALFRNPSGGVFWTGRGGAEFQTNQCLTAYTAPSTGYYGIVVVHDHVSSNPSSFTLAVTTTVPCNCWLALADKTPTTQSVSVPTYFDLVEQPFSDWEAIGERSPADWDLAVGPTASPNLACLTSTQGGSSLTPPKADVVAGDYTGQAAPETASVRVKLFSGANDVTVEADKTSGEIFDNGPKESQSLNADAIVRSYDVYLSQDTIYTFTLAKNADMKLLLFGNPNPANVRWVGRTGGTLFETTTSANYQPTWTGWYGLVVVKDDFNSGGYTAAYGHCSDPVPLVSRAPDQRASGNYYYSFNQPPQAWAAVCNYSPDKDWDIRQYDLASGSSWPDCFGSPGALSAAASGVDFVVGDFHHNASGTQYVRSYQYTSGVDFFTKYGFTEWDPGRGALQVNGAATMVNLASNDPATDRLWSYEVYLHNGMPYTFQFSRAGTADVKLFLFRNAAQGIYWAPRSAAEFVATSNQPYTPAADGWYGVVVVKDDDGTGSFSLRVTNALLAADNGPVPTRDGLHAITPNPTTGPMRVDFDLATAGAPEFELLDLQGRRVSRVMAGDHGPGRWSVAIGSSDDRGQSLAAGVYLVRMKLGERTVESRRIVIER